MSRPSTTGEFFYVVQPGDTLSKIVRELFHLHSTDAIQQKIVEVLYRNPHIVDANRIYPGQFLATGISDEPACFPSGPTAEDLQALQSVWAREPEDVRQTVRKNFDLLGAFDAIGATFTTVEKLMEWGEKRSLRVVSQMRPPPAIITEFERLLVRVRQEFFLETRNRAVQLVQRSRVSVVRQALVRIEVDAKAQRAYSEKLSRMTEQVKWLKWGGKVVAAADWIYSGYKVYDKWGTPEQNKTIVKEVSSKGAGAGGALVGGVVCAALSETIIVPIACAVVAGVGGSTAAEAWVEYQWEAISDWIGLP